MWRFALSSAAALVLAGSASADEPAADLTAIAAKIDELVDRHWQSADLTPAPAASDSAFLRRVTLDLVGRVPTESEARAFYESSSSEKRTQVVRQLIAGPEYRLHLAHVLDGIIQGQHAGDGEFVAWLRESLAEKKTWDRLFREVVLGPWETKEQARSNRFLMKRVKDVDDMTRDASRVFFGVDISCAKCHDHPLVDDWKQEHYFGLSSFFHRTYQTKKSKEIGERGSGDVTFTAHRDGQKRTAKLMFLSGQLIDEPTPNLDPRLADRRKAAEAEGGHLPPDFSRREQLVEAALAQRQFFSRSIVNRLWHSLHGYGVVHPIDQMHSENPPSVEGLIEWLADDLAEHGYNLDRTVAGIAASRAYQLSSVWNPQDQRPDAEHFAVASLRPLSPRVYANAIVLVTGDQSLDQAQDAADRAGRYQSLENTGRGFTRSLDPRRDDYQASVTEALYLSNNARVQQTLGAAGNNLTARLLKIEDSGELVDKAVWTVMSRPPAVDERGLLVQWLDQRGGEKRPQAVANLIWALITSAEFRFNH